MNPPPGRPRPGQGGGGKDSGEALSVPRPATGRDLRALTDRISDLFDDAVLLLGSDHPAIAALSVALRKSADAAVAEDRRAGAKRATEVYLERQGGSA